MGFLILILGLSFSAFAGLTGAPPAFSYRGSLVVPVDIRSIAIDYDLNVATKTVSARAVIHFTADQAGLPLIDLAPSPTSVDLDGQKKHVSKYLNVKTPGNESMVRVLNEAVSANSDHVLTVEYELDPQDVTFSSKTVRVGFFMSDFEGDDRSFFEKYGPANYEFDSVHYQFHVKVSGTDTAHEIFTNGEQIKNADNDWDIDFPTYFTTSSLYFHLVPENHFSKEEYVYSGIEKNFPVIVYASNKKLTQEGVSKSEAVLQELEATYGPFAHDRLVIYVTPSGGGMEYCGATITSLTALDHELTHSWFARGIMPTNGNSGWIDEAVASWRDDGYPRNNASYRAPVNLGSFSPFRRYTSRDSYDLGMLFISELDKKLSAKGGMKAALKELFDLYKRSHWDSEIFQSFLEGFSGMKLKNQFDRYVRGIGDFQEFTLFNTELLNSLRSHHPRPYTREELVSLR